jgi:hypothetical protein
MAFHGDLIHLISKSDACPLTIHDPGRSSRIATLPQPQQLGRLGSFVTLQRRISVGGVENHVLGHN